MTDNHILVGTQHQAELEAAKAAFFISGFTFKSKHANQDRDMKLIERQLVVRWTCFVHLSRFSSSCIRSPIIPRNHAA